MENKNKFYPIKLGLKLNLVTEGSLPKFGESVLGYNDNTQTYAIVKLKEFTIKENYFISTFQSSFIEDSQCVITHWARLPKIDTIEMGLKVVGLDQEVGDEPNQGSGQ